MKNNAPSQHSNQNERGQAENPRRPDIDFSQLRREILVAIRGPGSQVNFDRTLGLRSHRYHRWETGKTIFLWKHFVFISKHLGLSLADACREALGYTGPLQPTSTLIRHLLGEEKQTHTADRIGVSRSVISRWRSGHSEPSLETVLQLMHGGLFSLTGFLKRIVPPKHLSSLRNLFEVEFGEEELFEQFPWAAAVLLFVETDEYRNASRRADAFLARKIGVSVDLLREVTDRLLRLGLVKADGGDRVQGQKPLRARVEIDASKAVSEYWLARLLNRRDEARSPASHAQILFQAKPEVAALIRERYRAFLLEATKIIQSSEPGGNQVHLLCLQMTDISSSEVHESDEDTLKDSETFKRIASAPHSSVGR